ncbi:hypothetical protein XELAEV_18004480mg [Xenopus laevis]|uniref:G-protein coupled receptors family 3 profile domain-containing protein n=1 Tax=Xenopus laevis TaxID=8355 RepID=A0A974BR25_XENLA|nr:hypothetical protein XELAEV_18004480mg [Xenopus laevis]
MNDMEFIKTVLNKKHEQKKMPIQLISKQLQHPYLLCLLFPFAIYTALKADGSTEKYKNAKKHYCWLPFCKVVTCSLLQISYGATDPFLSDRATFPYFFRTVQSKKGQYFALTQLLKYFGWTWVGIITTNDINGDRAHQLLTTYLSMEGICIEFTIKITNADIYTQTRVYKEIIQQTSTSVVIFCGTVNLETAEKLQKLSDIFSEKTFIFTSDLMYYSYLIYYALGLFNGSVIISQNIAYFNEDNLRLRQFLDSVHPSKQPDDKLLEAIWMKHHACIPENTSVSFVHELIYSQHLRICTGVERLTDIETFIDLFYTRNMVIAVHTLILVSSQMHYLQNKLNKHSSVINFKHQFYHLLKKLQYPFEGQFLKSFNENGELVSPYHITYLYFTSTQYINETKIGMYTPWAPSDQKLSITWDAIKWKMNKKKGIIFKNLDYLDKMESMGDSVIRSFLDIVFPDKGSYTTFLEIVRVIKIKIFEVNYRHPGETLPAEVRQSVAKPALAQLCRNQEKARDRKRESKWREERHSIDRQEWILSIKDVNEETGIGEFKGTVQVQTKHIPRLDNKDTSRLSHNIVYSITYTGQQRDSENCFRCPDIEWPNNNRNLCVVKGADFLSYTSDVISGFFSSVSVFLFVLTLLILGIFIIYRDTPIVRANNRSLSFLLLVSIKLSFLSVFLFLGRPVDITCMLRNITFGITFSIAVSSLLAKTIMVCVAFKATKPGSSWRKWVGVKLSYSVVLFCSSIQIIICMTWLAISPPFQELDLHTYPGTIIIQCNEGSAIGFYSVIGYMGLLAAVSFVLAFLARTLPDSFNEAKYITFSMLLFCSVWITMIPAYLSTKGKTTVCVEIFAILTSSAGLLFCIFLPKCYRILFRPEINTKSHLLVNKIC